MKVLGEEQDRLLEWAMKLGLDTEVEYPDGRAYLRNNFEKGNLIFRPAACRAFELVWESNDG